MCSYCKIRKNQVCLQSPQFVGMSENTVFQILTRCSVIRPVHVLKKTISQQYCHLHFETEVKAASFYYTYCGASHMLCKSLRGLTVKPALENGDSIIYNKALYRQNFNEEASGWCGCPTTDRFVHNTTFKGMIRSLEEEIKETEENIQAKRRKLTLLNELCSM